MAFELDTRTLSQVIRTMGRVLLAFKSSAFPMALLMLSIVLRPLLLLVLLSGIFHSTYLILYLGHCTVCRDCALLSKQICEDRHWTST